MPEDDRFTTVDRKAINARLSNVEEYIGKIYGRLTEMNKLIGEVVKLTGGDE